MRGNNMKLRKFIAFLGAVLALGATPNIAHATVSNQTVQTTTGYGNGINTSFVITFDFRANSWIQVTRYDTSTTPSQVVSIPQNTTSGGFQVTGGNPGTTVVIGTAPSSTQYLVISRSIPLTQSTVFNPASIFPYQGVSNQLDYATLALQNIQYAVNSGGISGFSTIVSLTPVTHNWVNGFSSLGIPSIAQPAFTDLSGNLSVVQFNGGTGASPSTFARGDGTWALPNPYPIPSPSASGFVVVTNNAGNGYSTVAVTSSNDVSHNYHDECATLTMNGTSSAVPSQSGTWISYSSYSTPKTTFAFASGEFSATPYCTCTPLNSSLTTGASGSAICNITALSSSSITLLSVTNNGSENISSSYFVGLCCKGKQ